MRRFVVSNAVSLDGFLDGGRSPLAMELFGSVAEAFNAHNLDVLRGAATLLSGRATFEGHHGYWPALEHDEATDPVQREISAINNRVDKVVVSDTYRLPAGSPWATTTRVVTRADAAAHVAALREEDGGPGTDVVTFGSPTTWQPLLGAGLVDEVQLVVSPVALGQGVPAFPAGQAHRLRLLDVERPGGADAVVLRYAVGD